MHKDLEIGSNDGLTLIGADYQKRVGNNEIKYTLEQAKNTVDRLRNVMATKTAKCLPDFDDRPIFFDPPTDMTLPNTAIIVATSYPFGFHRCLRAMWIEKTKTGSRCVVITSAFGGSWNTPKRGTALDGFGFFMIDDENHWRWNNFDPFRNCSTYEGGKTGYTTEKLDEFLTEHGDELTTDELITAEQNRAYIVRRAAMLEAKQSATV